MRTTLQLVSADDYDGQIERALAAAYADAADIGEVLAVARRIRPGAFRSTAVKTTVRTGLNRVVSKHRRQAVAAGDRPKTLAGQLRLRATRDRRASR